MEDDLHTGTPYRISCLHQQPSGVDRRCQIWPIRRYTRFWYTVVSFLTLISRAFPCPLPQSPLVFPALSLAFFFVRAPLSERLEQANIQVMPKTWSPKIHVGCFPGIVSVFTTPLVTREQFLTPKASYARVWSLVSSNFSRPSPIWCWPGLVIPVVFLSLFLEQLHTDFRFSLSQTNSGTGFSPPCPLFGGHH